MRILQPALWYIGLVKSADTYQYNSWCHTNCSSCILSAHDANLYRDGKWTKSAGTKFKIGQERNDIIYILLDFYTNTLSIKIGDYI